MRQKIGIFSLIIALFTTSCGGGNSSSKSTENQKIQIVATTGMIADMVRNMCSDDVEVTSLMGPGVDPHLYKATKGDLEKLRDADLVLYNGLHLEGKMEEALKNLGKTKPVIAISTGVPNDQLISTAEFEGNHDPHIWFNPQLWILVTKKAEESIKTHLGKKIKKCDASEFISQIEAMDKQCKTLIDNLEESKRVMITAHDAFGYFAQHYGFKVRGLQGMSTSTEFGLNDIKSLSEFIIEHQVPAIFSESSVPEKFINQVIAECQNKNHSVSLGATLYSDALGDSGSKAGTYIGMLDYNVTSIVNALNK